MDENFLDLIISFLFRSWLSLLSFLFNIDRERANLKKKKKIKRNEAENKNKWLMECENYTTMKLLQQKFMPSVFNFCHVDDSTCFCSGKNQVFRNLILSINLSVKPSMEQFAFNSVNLINV